jgi:hypothetical protein
MDKGFQSIDKWELKKKLEDSGYWEKMHTGKLLESVRKTSPATIAPGGESSIVSYWDEHLAYLCTVHKVVTKEGTVIHEDVKDAFLGGIRYRGT